MVESRYAWGTLAVSALFLELSALFFQYGMQLEPCLLCVYERTAVLGVFAAGLIGVVAPSRLWLRVAGYLLWGASAGWGLYLAVRHTGIQLGVIEPPLSCNFEAQFPSWAKLDQWLPYVFQPSGYCDEIQWRFLSLSMPQWMVVIFALYILALLLVLVREVRRPA
jgi:disulfide bond formation protein DsbB